MIVDGLVTLDAVKVLAGIPQADTTRDAQLDSLINGASSAVMRLCDRKFKRTTYTAEPYSVNNHQYLYLREYPIQSVSSVTLAGAVLSSGVDYFLSGLDAEAGRLYRPYGWAGTGYARGTFPDVFAGARDIAVTYVAGYYLPADAGYVAGAAASLPLAISDAVAMAVASRLQKTGSEGLKALGEGGLSYQWFGPEAFVAQNGGFAPDVAGTLLLFARKDF